MVCFPYGGVSLIVGCLATAALALTYAFGMGCGYISFAGGLDVSTAQSYSYIGPWTAQLTEFTGVDVDDDDVTMDYLQMCYTYNSFSSGPTLRAQFDAFAKTAQAFSIMSMILSPFVFIILVMSWCMPFDHRGAFLWQLCAFLCAWLMFSSFMTLIMKRSVLCNNCEYGWSAWVSVAAGLVWFFTGVGMRFMPKEPLVGNDEGGVHESFTHFEKEDHTAATAAVSATAVVAVAVVPAATDEPTTTGDSAAAVAAP